MTNRRDKQFELDGEQISELIKLADFEQNDVFYDAGCGEGKVVIEVAKLRNVKKSIGIENEPGPYNAAHKAAIGQLTKEQLRKTDFWFGEMDARLADGCGYFYDMKDADVLFYSLHECSENIDWYYKRFKNRRLKVITKDLPLVGCKSVANRSNDDCWLFMMKNPFTPVRSKKEWIESVFGAKGLTMDHIYSYFGGQLAKRKTYTKKDITDTILDLEKVVNEVF